MAPKFITSSAVREIIAEVNDEALLADGFEGALIGYAQRATKPTVALYDREKCIAILMERDGMTRDVAEEHFEFNVVGAWVGESTPAFATILRRG